MTESNSKNFEGRLIDLLPIKMPHGFLLETLTDECKGCHTLIPQDQWNCRASWLGDSLLSLNVNVKCPECGTEAEVFLRLKSLPGGACEMQGYDEKVRKWLSYGLLQKKENPKPQKSGGLMGALKSWLTN